MRKSGKSGGSSSRHGTGTKSVFAVDGAPERRLSGLFSSHAACGSKCACISWGTLKFLYSVGIILAFTIPRVPSFVFNTTAPLGASTLENVPSPVFGQFPANFTFYSSIDVEVNTNANFLPLHFNSWRSEIYELNTGRKVATGEWGSYTLAAKKYIRMILPVTFNYTAVNTTDQTWANVYNSCRNKNQFADNKRPGMFFLSRLHLPKPTP